MNALARPAVNPPDVVERLVRDNRRLVYHLAAQFRSPLGHDELVAEGNVGLVIAAQKYDATRGVKFSTFASWWIRARIKSAIEHEAGCGKAHDARKVFWGLGRAYRALADTDGRASSAAIADLLGVDAQAVEDLRMHITQRELRLDATYANDSDVGGAMHRRSAIGAKLLVDAKPSAEEALLEDETGGLAAAAIRHALTALSSRARYVIEQHDLTEKRRTLQDIGDELGISRERVRQIRLIAIRKMRPALLAVARRQDGVPDWCDA